MERLVRNFHEQIQKEWSQRRKKWRYIIHWNSRWWLTVHQTQFDKVACIFFLRGFSPKDSNQNQEADYSHPFFARSNSSRAPSLISLVTSMILFNMGLWNIGHTLFSSISSLDWLVLLQGNLYNLDKPPRNNKTLSKLSELMIRIIRDYIQMLGSVRTWIL